MDDYRSARRKVQHPGKGEQLTKQSGREAADANLIWKRYINTGQLPAGNARAPHYGDFSGAVEYHTALEQIRRAEADFETLPAHIRDYCDNDPANLIELLNSENGVEQFDELTRQKPETEAKTRQRRREQPPTAEVPDEKGESEDSQE